MSTQKHHIDQEKCSHPDEAITTERFYDYEGSRIKSVHTVTYCMNCNKTIDDSRE